MADSFHAHGNQSKWQPIRRRSNVIKKLQVFRAQKLKLTKFQALGSHKQGTNSVFCVRTILLSTSNCKLKHGYNWIWRILKRKKWDQSQSFFPLRHIAAKWKQSLGRVAFFDLPVIYPLLLFARKRANAQDVSLVPCCHIINSPDYTSFIYHLLPFDVNQSDPPEPKFLALLCVTTNGIILVCCPHNQDDVKTGCSIVKKLRHNGFHSCKRVRSIIIYYIFLLLGN